MTQTDEVLVIYHADCLDGFGAAWSAFCKFKDQARYIPARHGDEMPEFTAGAKVYILDFCYPASCLMEAANTAGQIFLIDHHVTAMEQVDDYFKATPVPENLSINFDMNRSGCVLAWQHFFHDIEPPKILLHIEDRDLWKYKLDGTQEITAAIYERMPIVFTDFAALDLSELQAHGSILLAQFMGMVTRLAKSAHPVTVDGKHGLAVNAPSFFSSDLGQVLAKNSGTFGLIYQYDGKRQKWNFSLRSIGDFNVANMAKGFGGGGHKNAAGFSLDTNPFIHF